MELYVLNEKEGFKRLPKAFQYLLEKALATLILGAGFGLMLGIVYMKMQMQTAVASGW